MQIIIMRFKQSRTLSGNSACRSLSENILDYHQMHNNLITLISYNMTFSSDIKLDRYTTHTQITTLSIPLGSPKITTKQRQPKLNKKEAERRVHKTIVVGSRTRFGAFSLAHTHNIAHVQRTAH